MTKIESTLMDMFFETFVYDEIVSKTDFIINSSQIVEAR